jgi:hypothetical protein
MTLNPCAAWRTDSVAVLPRTAALGQHGFPQVVAVARVGHAAGQQRWQDRRADAPGQEEGGCKPVRCSKRPKSQAKMASSAEADASGHERCWSGSRTRRKPSAYGAPRGRTKAVRSLLQCG